MPHTLTILSKNLINIIYPLYCQICGIPLDPLAAYHVCAVCARGIQRIPQPSCDICGRSVAYFDSECADCKKRRFSFQMARSSCLYQGVIKKCIHLLKYRKKTCLFKILSDNMVSYIKDDGALLESIDMLVPVPLYPNKLRERGFNQSRIFAALLGKRFGIPLRPLLIKVKPTKPQSKLSKTERTQNLKGAFRVKNPGVVAHKRVMIIDDVFTTGATADECSQTLLISGAAQTRVFTLARGI